MRKASLLLLTLPFLLSAGAGAEESSCVACHSNPDYVEEPQLGIPAAFATGVHAAVGISCHDCHGGNPDPMLADDPDAMDPVWDPHPYVGAPAREEIPALCGSCHSDPGYMKRFRPDARVDQEAEYWTSQHGIALRAGDTNVATCIDCHSAHGIRGASDPESDVYPTKVAEMCGDCHADAGHMVGYVDRHGDPLRVDQLARWQESVHAAAMFDKEDLTAPTCNDCHGNHGAAPPGLESVSFVCGQCHGRAAGLFRSSAKHDGFLSHNEYLVEAGDEGCAACHDAPQADLELAHFSECATCHGNHGVVRPTIAMFSALPATPCEFCHAIEESGGEPRRSLERQTEARDALLGEAAALGLDGQDRFDWMVEQAAMLPAHSTVAEPVDASTQRPEFAELFRRFRIGKSFTTYIDPVSGEKARAVVVRCGDCHASDEESAGTGVAVAMLEANRELMMKTARAERTLLAARRGGVEVGEVLTEVERAVDAEIGLAALVHSFSADEGSDYMTQHAEGLEAAEAALENGHRALEEMAFRRQGLGVALVVILALLVALALKIRSLSP